MISTNYIILSVDELDEVLFSEINETAIDTLRISNDGNLTFISWDGETPTFINKLITKSSIYSEAEMLELLEGADWKKLIITN
jgi:hypothetical protein